MDRRLLTSLLLLIVLSRTCLAQPTLKINGEADGVRSANRLFGSTVGLVCQFPQLALGGNNIYRVTLRTQASDGQKNNEVECQYTSGGDSPASYLYKDKTLNLTGSGISCSDDGTSATFSFRAPLSDRVVYDCLVIDSLNPDNSADSDDVTVNVYTKPEDPVILPDPLEVEEGKPITFRCSSEGYPPPQLSIKLDGVTKKEAPVQDAPSPPSLTNVSLEWNPAVITNEMHEKNLLCQVNNHLYSGRVETEKMLYVIHGPYAVQKELTQTYDIKSKAPLVLNGTMKGYPQLEYKWFAEGEPVKGGDETLTVDSSLYDSFVEFPQILTFKVSGRNPRISKSADRTIKVTVQEPIDSTTAKDGSGPVSPTAGGNAQGSTGLQGWHIAIIVIAIVVVLVAVVVGVILKRKSANSAMKSKAAQARRSSDERSDPKYQSSTASLHQDNAARHAGYHENPTLPAEYRYSQGNVEQYAEVIDDMPRSRKPIALDDMEMFDGGNAGPPMFEEAPPAYGDMGQYRGDPNYSTYSPNYSSTYGAAC